MERIICSAVHFKNNKKYHDQPINIEKGYVISGRRHNNCYATYFVFNDKRKPITSTIDGFITDTDRFVDRIEGYQIALKANQLLYYSKGGVLSSEMIFE